MQHDYSGDVPADTINTVPIGAIQVARGFSSGATIRRVVARQEGANDAEWNINVAGNAIFSSTQSVASADTTETFQPDQNTSITASADAIEVDVTASSGTSGRLAVGLLVDDRTGKAQEG